MLSLLIKTPSTNKVATFKSEKLRVLKRCQYVCRLQPIKVKEWCPKLDVYNLKKGVIIIINYRRSLAQSRDKSAAPPVVMF